MNKESKKGHVILFQDWKPFFEIVPADILKTVILGLMETAEKKEIQPVSMNSNEDTLKLYEYEYGRMANVVLTNIQKYDDKCKTNAANRAKRKDSSQEIDNYISGLGHSDDYKNVVRQYVLMRSNINKPITLYALQNELEKLKDLSETVQIERINYSICGSYPLLYRADTHNKSETVKEMQEEPEKIYADLD